MEGMTQSGSSPIGGRPRLRHRTRGQARQQELETQLQSMDITDEEEDGNAGVDQDMQDVDSTNDHQTKSSAEDEDEEGDGDDEAEEFGKPLALITSQSISDLFIEHGLTDTTHTTLSRLRKDRLVKMCEARDLDTEGTKKDLIQFLLGWVSRISLVFPRSMLISFSLGCSAMLNPGTLCQSRLHRPRRLNRILLCMKLFLPPLHHRSRER